MSDVHELEIIDDIERALEAMHRFQRAVPAPCLLYGPEDTVDWCNKSMLNLFWATLE